MKSYLPEVQRGPAAHQGGALLPDREQAPGGGQLRAGGRDSAGPVTAAGCCEGGHVARGMVCRGHPGHGVSGDRPLRIAMVIDSWDDAANGAVISTRRFTDLLRAHGAHRHHSRRRRARAGQGGAGDVLHPVRQRHHAEDAAALRVADARHRGRDHRRTGHGPHPIPLLSGHQGDHRGQAAWQASGVTFHVQAEHLLYNIGVRNQGMVERVYRFFLRTMYDRSDHVICPSAFAEAELRTRGLKAPSA